MFHDAPETTPQWSECRPKVLRPDSSRCVRYMLRVIRAYVRDPLPWPGHDERYTAWQAPIEGA